MKTIAKQRTNKKNVAEEVIAINNMVELAFLFLFRVCCKPK